MDQPKPRPKLVPFLSAEGDRLGSWKEIAVYLNTSVRTVQRWEKTEGLPVHRHKHASRGTVYANRLEVDVWYDSRRQRLESEEGIDQPPPR